MKTKMNLAEHNHPLVSNKAKELIKGETTVPGKLEKLFHYVRDDIIFGFPKNGDLTTASDTIRLKMGQCNTKGTLFLALCRAAGIPARMHFSLIKKEIQRGLFPGIFYKMLPDFLSHGWVEVEVDGKWRRIDSYINDRDFYRAGKQEIKTRGWDTGFSVACSSGNASIALSLDKEAFVQMDAVVEDHGVWDDPSVYYATDYYRNRPNAIKLLLYRIRIGRINRKVDQMRNGCAGGLCGTNSAARHEV